MSKIDNIFSNMTIREKIGQLLMPDFRFWGKENEKYKPLIEVNNTILKIIKNYNLGGVALFRENMGTNDQIIKLTNDLQDGLKIKLLLGIDQEGGIVTRLQSGTDTPGNMLLGATRSEDLTEKTSTLIGDELNSLGINLNFAPTIDVNSNQKNPIIGVRSFSDNTKLVTKLGASYIKGMKKSNVFSCVKHFPGHGNTATDTHLGLATIDYNLRELNEIDLPPFIEAINSGVETMMIAHVIVPVLDNTKIISKKTGEKIGVPATFSKKIITDLLIEKMKFKGLILTDALDMKAISEHFGVIDSTIKTILAGSDMALMSIKIYDEDEVYKIENFFLELEKEYGSNIEFKKRVNQSVMKILKMKLEKNLIVETVKENSKNKVLASEIVGSYEHKNFEKIVSKLGITLIKNEDEILPYKLKKKNKILIIGKNKLRIKILKEELAKISKLIKKEIEISEILLNENSLLNIEYKNKINNCDFIFCLTYNLKTSNNIFNEFLKHLNEKIKSYVVISTCNPYDIAYLENAKTNIAVYGASGFDQTNLMQSSLKINIQTSAYIAVIDLDNKELFFNPVGKLPVTISNEKSDKVLYEYGHGLTYK